jgi:hypothetical protein
MNKPLLSDQITEFIFWLRNNTDFGDWDLETQGVVHKKLIECLISVPAEQCNERWAGYNRCIKPLGHSDAHITSGGFDWIPVEPRTGAGSLD